MEVVERGRKNQRRCWRGNGICEKFEGYRKGILPRGKIRLRGREAHVVVGIRTDKRIRFIVSLFLIAARDLCGSIELV